MYLRKNNNFKLPFFAFLLLLTVITFIFLGVYEIEVPQQYKEIFFNSETF